MPSELWLKIFLFPGLLVAPIWGANALRRRQIDLRWLTPALLTWLALLTRALGVALLVGVIAVCHARERLGLDDGPAKWRQELTRAAVGTAVFLALAGLSALVLLYLEFRGPWVDFPEGALMLASFVPAFACVLGVSFGREIRKWLRPASEATPPRLRQGIAWLGVLGVVLLAEWAYLCWLMPYFLHSLGLIHYVGYGAFTCIALAAPREDSLSLLSVIVLSLWLFQSLWARCAGPTAPVSRDELFRDFTFEQP